MWMQSDWIYLVPSNKLAINRAWVMNRAWRKFIKWKQIQIAWFNLEEIHSSCPSDHLLFIHSSLQLRRIKRIKSFVRNCRKKITKDESWRYLWKIIHLRLQLLIKFVRFNQESFKKCNSTRLFIDNVEASSGFFFSFFSLFISFVFTFNNFRQRIFEAPARPNSRMRHSLKDAFLKIGNFCWRNQLKIWWRSCNKSANLVSNFS